MGDIARCSIYNEELLYRLFGKNAELLIDHAWGWEPCTIADVKGYRPQVCSLSSGQVLHRAYESSEALLVLREMADALALELVSKALVTDQIVLTVGYDIDNLKQGSSYQGVVKIDRYGRRVPQHAHGSFNLGSFSSSSKLLVQAAADLYERITDSNLLVRRLPWQRIMCFRRRLLPRRNGSRACLTLGMRQCSRLQGSAKTDCSRHSWRLSGALARMPF